MSKNRHAVVLGATGMVGTPLCHELLAHGWEVTGACRFSRVEKRAALENAGVNCVEFDVLQDDPQSLPDADVLFLEIWDPATMSTDDTEYVWKMNYYGLGRVVERYAGVADIVNGCTINVYGDSSEAPSENTPCRPTSAYGRSRYAQERLIDFFCWRGKTKGIHVRYAHANTAGKGVVFGMARAILNGDSLGPDPDARMQIIAIEDFVRVTREAASRLKYPPTAVNCCHPRVWTRRELAEEIHRKLGRGRVVFDRETGGLETSVYADVTRMLDWFGPPTITVDTVIDRTVTHILAEAQG